VHTCVAAILSASKFPEHPTDYTVEGRVNRPSPPGPPGSEPRRRDPTQQGEPPARAEEQPQRR
jgi:hypothetical protein